MGGRLCLQAQVASTLAGVDPFGDILLEIDVAGGWGNRYGAHRRETVANRTIRVWHGATENGPLNEAQRTHLCVVRVALGTGYSLVRVIGRELLFHPKSLFVRFASCTSL